MNKEKTDQYRSSGISDSGSGWEHEFRKHGRIWGDKPGALARITLEYLNKHSRCIPDHILTDLGCGYGRDSLYFAKHCHSCIYGIDSSETAIEAARKSALETGLDPGIFHCGNFLTADYLPESEIVYSSNVYQILRPGEREMFRERIRTILKRGGVFFQSTLSVNDPEHHGKGISVEGEADSCIGPGTGKYLHLCTKEEIARDFAFLKIEELFEIEYIEPRTGGDHHHRSWILAGRNQGHFR